MTITYSIQPSTLLPEEEVNPYGRYMVQTTSSASVPVSVTTEEISNFLKAGSTVNLVDEGEVIIGTLMPTLKGGFVLATEPTPVDTQLNVGFRPSPKLLEYTRFEVTFARSNTVVRAPSISLISDWYQNERTDNSISINGGHSTYIEIKGVNLKLGNTLNAELTEIGGGGETVTLASDTGLIKWSDRLISFNTKIAMTTPEAPGMFTLTTPQATGIFTLTIGDKITTAIVNIINRT